MIIQESGRRATGRAAVLVLLFVLLAGFGSAAPMNASAGRTGRTQERSAGEPTADWERRLVLPPEISVRLAWAKKSLRPSGLQKIERMALLLAPGIAAGTAFAGLRKQAEADIVASFAGLAGMDVSEAAFLVMALATKDMDDDIRMIMTEIQAMAAAKQKLRETIKDLNQWISREMSKHPASEDIDRKKVSGSGGAGRIARPPDKARPLTVPPISLQKTFSPVIRFEFVRAPAIPPLPPKDATVTVAGLKNLLKDLQGKLDGMNEMSEMTSLRLQMTMDRRSKFIQTLSQMMKKTSTTQDILVQNIK